MGWCLHSSSYEIAVVKFSWPHYSHFCSPGGGGVKSHFWFYAGEGKGGVGGLWKQKAFPSVISKISKIPSRLRLGKKMWWIISIAIWYWISQTVVYLDERFTGDFEILQKTYLLKQFISGGNFIFPDDFISFYRLWFKQYFLRKSRVQLWKIPMVSRKWSIIPLWF